MLQLSQCRKFLRKKEEKNNENITKSLIVQRLHGKDKRYFVTTTRLYPCVQGKTLF